MSQSSQRLSSKRGYRHMGEIVGIGTDLVEISRISEAIRKNERFLSRFYGESELAMLREKDFKAQSVAANFAGKEAVLKVFGTGLRGCQLREIEILRSESGKPLVSLSGDALKIAEAMGIQEVLISLSHTKEHALAYAIGIRREEECY